MGLAELGSLVFALEHYGGALAHVLDPTPYVFADDVAATTAELLAHLAAIVGKAWLKSYQPPKLKIARPWEPDERGPAKMSTREEFKSFLGGVGTVRLSKPKR